MMTLNVLPHSWKLFIQSISGQSKFPKFDWLWSYCTQEETRLVARGKMHGPQNEESQALASHGRRGKGKGRKSLGRKSKGGRSG